MDWSKFHKHLQKTLKLISVITGQEQREYCVTEADIVGNLEGILPDLEDKKYNDVPSFQIRKKAWREQIQLVIRSEIFYLLFISHIISSPAVLTSVGPTSNTLAAAALFFLHATWTPPGRDTETGTITKQRMGSAAHDVRVGPGKSERGGWAGSRYGGAQFLQECDAFVLFEQQGLSTQTNYSSLTCILPETALCPKARGKAAALGEVWHETPLLTWQTSLKYSSLQGER